MVRTAIVMAFCPVVDAGLKKFLKEQRGLGCTMWVLTPRLVRECCIEMARCDALDAEDVVHMVERWKFFRSVQSANGRTFRTLRQRKVDIVMPDTSVSRAVASRCLQGHDVIFAPLPQCEGV